MAAGSTWIHKTADNQDMHRSGGGCRFCLLASVSPPPGDVNRYPTEIDAMIRPASEGDVHRIAESLVRLQNIHADAYPSIYRRFNHADAVTHLQTSLSNPDITIRVACDDTEVIGHYILATESTPETMFKHSQRFGHLHQIEVDPRFRRRGTAKILLNDVISISGKLGLHRVILDVWAFNTAARGLFDSVGFTLFGSKLVYDVKLLQNGG
ncbi:putative acetyltransferase YhhY [Rubripirellula tenax]|uniref:Putative acetyltransferase YhhY n=1 Tax=Rubripirellula tenax TaxID=2528015 RepID=A0A5C6E9V3_9BACT|nr:GNAT family N-acetyltransferase [Rubripirellula tenax]TWU44727.1 putative acetyltransferase YhhY [Rubripirellula tenax]